MTSLPRLFGGILLAWVAVAILGAAAAPQRAAAPRPIKTTPPTEWPDAPTMAKQKRDAENRALFASTTPVAFTLTADFKAVQKDRAPDSTKTYPATIDFARNDGSPATANLLIRTRGNVRRTYDICFDFAPIRLEFPKDQMKGTVFDGQHILKLGVHCNKTKEYEQYVLREYAAYRISNLVTPRSFRARLAKATYLDAVTKKSLGTKYGMLIEDDEDVAKRLEGRVITEQALLSHLDVNAFAMMSLFEYMIGNLDMSIIGEHNVKLVQTPNLTVYPIPYDFDYSGLVDAVYARAPPALKVGSVRERLYRGPCRTGPVLEAMLAKFRAIQPEIAPIYDSLADFDPGGKKKALAYLEQFYRTINRPIDVKFAFVNNCLKSGLM